MRYAEMYAVIYLLQSQFEDFLVVNIIINQKECLLFFQDERFTAKWKLIILKYDFLPGGHVNTLGSMMVV